MVRKVQRVLPELQALKLLTLAEITALRKVHGWLALDARGDWLTLTTVLMAISLFLLGVAAVVRSRKVQYSLIIIGSVIFVFAAAIMFSIPMTWV